VGGCGVFPWRALRATIGRVPDRTQKVPAILELEPSLGPTRLSARLDYSICRCVFCQTAFDFQSKTFSVCGTHIECDNHVSDARFCHNV
jgi:hypothetical protein